MNSFEDIKLDMEEGREQPKVQSSANVSSVDSSKRPRRHWLVVSSVLAVVCLVAILVPVLLNRNDDDNSSTSVAESQSSTNNNSSFTGYGNATGRNTVPSKPTFVDIDGIFNVSLPLFSEQATEVYDGRTSLNDDIQNSAFAFLNGVVKRNLQINVSGYQEPVYNRGDGGSEYSPVAAPTTQDAAVASPSVGDNVNSYETNNQESNVREGDVVVSDGAYLYMAYSDYIEVVNPRTGELVQQLQMPAINVPNSSASNFGRGYNGGVADVFWPYYDPKPYISSMIAIQDRLLLIVGNYGLENAPKLVTDRPYPILGGFQDLQIRIYDTSALSSGGKLKLLKVKTVNGSYLDAREVDGVVQMTAISYIDTYTDLGAPFERYLFANLTDSEYIAMVQDLAAKQVEKFTKELDYEMSIGSDSQTVTKIAAWSTDVSGVGINQDIYNGNSFINSIVQVYSIDLASASSSDTTVSASVTFIPSYWAQVYATPNTIIIAGQAGSYDETTGLWNDQTYLLALAINGATTTPTSAGIIDGYVLNSYSIDVVGNVLRIATSQNQWTFVIDPIAAYDSEGSGSTTTATAITPTESRTKNFIIMLQLPGLDGDQPGAMQELGRVKLGKVNELFTAVRFFDNVAYAVTFERTDPLYVVDVSNPVPVVLGEFEITGFSSYLYSINDDNTLLLAIGEEADSQGVSIGFAITVFDASDPTNIQAVQRKVIEQDANSYSGSAAQWDFKAFRYVADRLIIPLSIYNYDKGGQNFDGYVVYIANADTIEESCRIANVDLTKGSTPVDVCYYCGYVAPRSFVFDGNVVTTSYRYLRSTDLDTCRNVWSLDISIQGDDSAGCCGIFYY